MYLIKTVSAASLSDPDYLAHGAVRHDVYVNEMGWIDPREGDDGREADRYDQ